MIARIFSLFLVMTCLSSIALRGGVVPGRWEKIEGLEAGTGIVVSLNSGEKMDSFYRGTTEDGITVVSSDGQEHKLPKSAVAKIETLEKKRGPVWDGALIGAAVGMAVSGALLAKYGDSSIAGAVLGFYGGLGAGIGLAIDAGVAGRKKPSITWLP